MPPPPPPQPPQPGPAGPPPASSPTPSASLALDQAHVLLSAFSGFLTVAIHNILFYRNVYPPATFLSTRAHNLAVHQSRHPRVCAWVRDAVEAVAAQLSAGHVARVAVVIHAPPDPSRLVASASRSQSQSQSRPELGFRQGPSSCALPPNAVLERWLIDTSRFPAWPTSGRDGAGPNPKATTKAMHDFSRVLAREARSEEARERQLAGDEAAGLVWADVDEQLRGALRRMAAAAEGMAELPAGCGFTVAVELKEEGRAPIGVSIDFSFRPFPFSH